MRSVSNVRRLLEAVGSRAISNFLFFALSIFIAKSFGAEARGNFGFLVNFSTFCGIVGGLSLGRGALASHASHTANIPRLLTHARNATVLLPAALTALSLPLALMFFKGTSLTAFFLPAIILAIYFSWSSFSPIAFALQRKLPIFDRFVIITRVIIIAVVVALHARGLSYNQTILALSLSVAVIIALELFLLRADVELESASKTPLKKLYVNSLTLHLDTLSGLTVSTLIPLVVAFNLPHRDFGVYSLSQQMMAPLTIIPAAFGLMVTQSLSEKRHESNKNKIRFCLRMTALSTALTALSILALLLFGQFAFHWIGKDFGAGTKYFYCLVWGALSFPISQTLVPLWTVMNKARTISLFSLLTSGIAVATSPFAIRNFGIWGAIGTQLLVYMTSILMNAILTALTIKNVEK